ncbi:hypothetical protein G6F56_012770 [Rhizopus delemar]|nr:hypothetical protein G6F56_012770 [Rhizopus delemar]
MLKVIREVSRGELGMQGSDLVSDDFDLNEEIIELENYPSLASQPSMFRLMTDISNLTVKEKEKDTYNLKSLIIQEITEEIITDLDTIYKGIADQALDFIHEK